MSAPKEKQRRAVLVSVSDEDGKLRLRLDDVVQLADTKDQWKYDVHYTSKLYPGDLKELKFSEKELADFGYHIMARLSAFNKRNEI